MTALSSPSDGRTARALVGLPRIPWPRGTTWFAFRTWVALAIGYYAAFFLELDGASSAGVCVLILAQPQQGMVLSKAIYRFAATIVGVSVAILLTALFPQDRTMLLASFAAVMAIQTALGSVFRDFRSYACILAGYTIAIISIANIDTPDLAFSASVNRVAAIVVGIAAIAVTNMVLATTESSLSLTTKLRSATTDIIELALDALDRRCIPDAATCVDLSARLMPLRSEISFATPEKVDGRARAKGARSALLGLFEMLSAIQGVGIGLQALDRSSAIVDEAVSIARRAIRLQNPETCTRVLESLALPAIEAGSLSMPEAFVLDRLHFLIETLSYVRDGLRSLRTGWLPRRNVAIEVHQDWFAVAVNAMRVLVAVGIVAVLSVWSGIADTATAILFTAVFVSLGAVQPDPNIMGRTALLGMPAVVAVGALYAFFVFPLIDDYPLFIVSLLPLVVAMCWFVMIGKAGAGLIFGVQTIVLIGPANVQTLVPETFVNTAAMLTVSGVAIFLAFQLVLPVDPAQRRLRLVLAVGSALRNALADTRRREQPRASLQYDRLAQFKTWQRNAAPTLARRKTMKRLVDIGNLALVVRRAWRGLDRARSSIDPAIDAAARRVLPSLSPERTGELAGTYLQAARGSTGQPALALVHAAAALHGVALLTTNEMRLLKRVHLLNRLA